MRYLRSRLLRLAQEDQQRQEAAARKAQVGTADRSEKIRTYNFPQNRVTDHRVNVSVHNLPRVMEGALDDFIDALLEEERREKLGSDASRGPEVASTRAG